MVYTIHLRNFLFCTLLYPVHSSYTGGPTPRGPTPHCNQETERKMANLQIINIFYVRVQCTCTSLAFTTPTITMCVRSMRYSTEPRGGAQIRPISWWGVRSEARHPYPHLRIFLPQKRLIWSFFFFFFFFLEISAYRNPFIKVCLFVFYLKKRMIL